MPLGPLFVLLLKLLFLLNGSSLFGLLTLGSLGISSLLARPLAEPLGKPLGRPLGPLFVLLLPDGVQGLGADDLPTALVQLLPVLVGPCVSPPLVLGVHADGRRVFSAEGLRVETLLQGFLSQLGLLSLLQLVQLVILGDSSLLIVVFVGFKCDHNVEQLLGLVLQIVGVHGIEVEGLDSDGESDLLLLLQLLLGLGHLTPGISSTTTSLLGATSASLVGLLSLKHLLPLGLGLFQAFLFLLSLLGLFLVFILPQFFLLFLLLLVELLLLLGSDLLPLGLLLLQLLQLLLLLLPGLSPLIDVLFEGLIESCLGCCLVLPIRGHNSSEMTLPWMLGTE